ncbi:conserved hypothetical protein [Leishmania infantum JPCM5]|uniref:Uncharacterized protein n=2 Tax=Leishmania infantum TaxID=5671 RepID=A4I864_LEIIN|nr:conserved hypothetical protein [Leishmania infantum JPCM5]CAC9526319.1 hypothetical_protein_-_conserved [Leishmania infantum]CAM71005.1 conserved hypothetical protein [Leishmania infantum JPCM5]SUZ44824.1 hypothetical_protein_-_conserved [Leishmania infantum]|eukprot:XP_001467933.1 conserved hypothetical protein [Leishmania infantum JPCM5]
MNTPYHASVVISPVAAAASSSTLRCGRQSVLCRIVARTLSSEVHFCRALEPLRRGCRIPGLGSLLSAARDFSSTTPSYLPAFDVFNKRQTSDSASSSAIAGAPSPSRSSCGRAHADHHRHQHSPRARRRSCTPQDTDASASTEPYAFPVGRALRYVQLGRRYHGQTEGQSTLYEWLAEMPFPPSAEAAGPLWGNGGADVEGCSTSKTDTHGPELVAEVSSFAKYHAHHALIEFKELRRRIAEAESCAQVARVGSQRPANSSPPNRHERAADRNAEEPSPSSSTSPSPTSSLSPHPLPAHLAAALTQSLFSVTVLLHVSGLFGVADTHVERLLDVCFSTSIFLAQDSAAAAALTRRQRGNLSAPSSASEFPRRHGATAAFVEAPPRSRHLHSLHWAIVHFAAGVQHWGLLEHTSPLQDVGRTQRSYERLLQVHAALLCEQTRRCVDHVLWHELVLLKAGRRAEAARDAWFMGPDAAAYSVLFGAQSNSSSSCGNAADAGSLARRVPPRLQQRRLQLLPLLWLSLLCSQLQKRQTPTAQTPSTCAAPHSSPSPPDAEEVTWASARHAFAALLPLFSKDARLDVTAWAALHLLFLPHRRARLSNAKGAETKMTHACTISAPAAAANATLPELCALLARVEREGALLELGPALPGPASAHAESSAYFHLASFLRCWLDASTARSSVPSSPGTARAELADSSGCIHRGDNALNTLQTPMHTADQLYRALLNIPLSALFLPSPKPSSGDGLCSASVLAEYASTEPSLRKRLSVTAEGARLLNRLLLRVLLQWRSDRRVRRVPQRSGGASARSTSEKLPSAGGVAPIAPECSSSACTPCTESAGSGGRREAIEAAQGDRPPGALPASQPGLPQEMTVSAAESRRQWERELVCVLKATHHLGALITAGAADGVSRDGSSDRGTGLIRAFVAPTAQAVVRALAEQLGRSLLPWRLLLLHCEHVPLTAVELQLLGKLDATLRHVLLLYSPQRVRASDAAASTTPTDVGSLPMTYRVSMNALMRTAA